MTLTRLQILIFLAVPFVIACVMLAVGELRNPRRRK